MPELVGVVQDNITGQKLKLNVSFQHATFEKCHQMILSQLIMPFLFKCYLIRLSSGINLFLLLPKLFIILFILLIALALKLSV